MSETRTCPDCGGSLPPDALDGDCPRCLLAAGLEGDDDGSTDDVPPPPRPEPPPVEDIAPHFPALAVEGLIGAGGMGIVYRARQTALDRPVALKVLWPQLAEDRSFADRFTREARAMARLDHPNIVRVFEFGEREGWFFLVMELVDGKSLRELMDGGGIRADEALAIVPQICAALQYAHDQGVVHRDIKPANVLVDRTGRVRIADFGLAKLVEGEDVTLTRAGQVMGTLHYMAPEQYKTPDHVDHRADIYSLGVVFYEMLTGEVPVGRFRAPSEKVQVDVRLDQVVLRSLEREPEMRYQKAADVGTAVTSISSGEEPPPAPTPVVPAAAVAAPREPKPPPRVSKIAVAALVMVGVQALFALTALAAPEMIVLSLIAAAFALGLGFIGTVRVLGSGGTLRGAGYAGAALIAPWFVGCGGLLALSGMAASHGIHGMDPIRIEGETVRFGEITFDEDGVRIGDAVEISDRGVRVNEPIEIDDRGIRRVPADTGAVPKPTVGPAYTVESSSPFSEDAAGREEACSQIVEIWERLQARNERTTNDDPRYVYEYYTGTEATMVGALSETELEDARRGDLAGLPLLRFPYGRRLHRYRLSSITFDPDGTAADVIVTGEDGALHFPMVRGPNGWKFEVGFVNVVPPQADER
jgi:predicted Ser/Thr protein kinase